MWRWMLVMLAACSRDPRHREPPHPAAPAPVALADAGVAPAAVGWQRVELADSGVSVELLAGPFNRIDWHPGGTLQQATPEVGLAVRFGADETLENWQQLDVMGSEWTLAPPRALTVCGKAARMQVAEAPAWHGEVKDRTGYHMASLPARTEVILAFAQGRMGVTLRWTVNTEQRAAQASAEQHFFTSTICR